MLSGITITCFAASYLVVLVLEVTRLLFRSGVRGAIMLGFAGAGLLAHTIFLAGRSRSAQGSPLSSEMDWYLLAAWVLVAVYLYLVYYHPKVPFGLFLMPLALGLIGAAAAFADREPFAREPASRIWGIIHGTALLVAAVTVLLGFAAGLMYLYQARRLKHKLPPGRGLRMPSLEWLQRVNGRALVVSTLALGVGVLSGMNLNRINYRRHESALPWDDPLVLATLGLFAWLLISVGVGAVYRPARAGRKVAYLTLVSFVFLVLALSVMLFMDTQHGGARGQGTGFRVQRPGVRGQGARVPGSQAPAWEPMFSKLRFVVWEAELPGSAFPSWSLGTRPNHHPPSTIRRVPPHGGPA